MAVNDRIRDAREKANLSVNALAKRVGVSSTAAWNWDWGNTSPRPEKLPKIAEALAVTVEYLTDGMSAPVWLPQPEAKRETLDSILLDASERIAALLGINTDRVDINFNLK